MYTGKQMTSPFLPIPTNCGNPASPASVTMVTHFVFSSPGWAPFFCIGGNTVITGGSDSLTHSEAKNAPFPFISVSKLLLLLEFGGTHP